MIYFQEKELTKKKRYDIIKGHGDDIIKLVNENMTWFKANEDSEKWKSYIEYLDEMVVEGFFQCINCSLNFLLNSTDPKLCSFPLFEARLELQAPDVVFVPSLEFNVHGGFYDMMDEILSDVYQQAGLIERLATHYDHNSYKVNSKG